MKTEKFVFEVSIDAVPHTKSTSEKIYGENSYNSDFPIQSHASDLLQTCLRDAFTYCSQSLMKYLVEKGEPDNMNESDRSYYHYLQKKLDVAEAVMDSMKFARIDDTKPTKKKAE